MPKSAAAALVAVILAAACAGGNDPEPAVAPAATTDASAPSFERARAVLAGGRGRVPLEVEVAETEEQRRHGLMFRRSLPENSGMVFVFPADVTGGFWMKNTVIPLSIAFYDARGRILRILDMKPCRTDSCPVYDPGIAYRGALEVNRGAFRRWGVEEGDRIRLER